MDRGESQATSTDPLTDILAPAATTLTCTTPDNRATEKSPEINAVHPLSGECCVSWTPLLLDNPLQSVAMQRLLLHPCSLTLNEMTNYLHFGRSSMILRGKNILPWSYLISKTVSIPFMINKVDIIALQHLGNRQQFQLTLIRRKNSLLDGSTSS